MKPVIALKPMTWYIADVAFTTHNPIHRCVAHHRGRGHLELIGSYELEEMPIRSDISELAYFSPIKELPEMKQDPEHSFVDKAPRIIYIKE